MNKIIHRATEEVVEAAVSRQLYAIKFNLANVFGGLLYSLKLENEKQGGVGDIAELVRLVKQGGVGDIAELVRLVVDSSRYDGPEGEEYPVWDDKAAKVILDRLERVLQAHGIEQAWNIGRGKNLKAKS